MCSSEHHHLIWKCLWVYLRSLPACCTHGCKASGQLSRAFPPSSGARQWTWPRGYVIFGPERGISGIVGLLWRDGRDHPETATRGFHARLFASETKPNNLRNRSEPFGTVPSTPLNPPQAPARNSDRPPRPKRCTSPPQAGLDGSGSATLKTKGLGMNTGDNGCLQAKVLTSFEVFQVAGHLWLLSDQAWHCMNDVADARFTVLFTQKSNKLHH